MVTPDLRSGPARLYSTLQVADWSTGGGSMTRAADTGGGGGLR